jgi:hypothetical protein
MHVCWLSYIRSKNQKCFSENETKQETSIGDSNILLSRPGTANVLDFLHVRMYHKRMIIANVYYKATLC